MFKKILSLIKHHRFNLEAKASIQNFKSQYCWVECLLSLTLRVTTLITRYNFKVSKVDLQSFICILLQIHGKQFGNLFFQHERGYAGSAQNIKTSRNLCQSLQFLALTLLGELFELLLLQVCFHCEVIACLRVVEYQFAELAVYKAIQLLSFQAVDFSSLSKQRIWREVSEVDWLNDTRSFQVLCITWSLNCCITLPVCGRLISFFECNVFIFTLACRLFIW